MVEHGIVPVDTDCCPCALVNLVAHVGLDFNDVSPVRWAVVDAIGLLAERVLVDCNEFIVLQDVKGVLICRPDISSNNQRSFSESPKTELSHFFLEGKSTNTDFKHIGIIPISWSSIHIVLLTLEVV